MKRRNLTALAGALGAAAVLAAVIWQTRGPRSAPIDATALVGRYCLDCHNANDFAGELRLDDKDATHVALDAEIWERVVRKLRTGMMPPADAPRPDRDTLDALAARLELNLDAVAHTDDAEHRGALRRLNRTEYANAIADLLHLDVDAASLLPLDDSSEGFDNVATALGVSPSLVEAWVSTAMKISRNALGDSTAPETQVSYAASERLRQDRHIEGLPLGTRGGMRIEHAFPLDAEYTLRIRNGFRLPRSARLIVTLDGEEIDFSDAREVTLPITAGPHSIAAALIDTRRPTGVDNVYGVYDVGGAISGIDIDGPLRPSGLGNTPSREHILSCTPTTPDEETACAESIIRSLAVRAFRRPVSREALEPFMNFYALGHAAAGFEGGIEQALARILVDPRFLYRIEAEPATLPTGTAFEIDDYALASRLSFFLWSSIPDDELLALADSGTLRQADVLSAQVTRMLADEKSAALVQNFAAQWLFLRELESVTPDAEAFDANLQEAMIEETERLFATVMHEDLSVVRLLDADFTWLNQRLAEHYGIDDVRGSYFRRVTLPPDSPRRGLLGHASILTLTSVTNRTSPVIRGSWILETLLGSPPPVPPPNVETTLEGDDGGIVAATVRERLEAHRANPTCASCHAVIDPIGFALEGFDLIGAQRDSDNGLPIDTNATLVDGTPIDGPAALRNALLSRDDVFVTTMTEKMLTYALGRSIEYADMPVVRDIVRQAQVRDYRFSALIHGIVTSEPFLSHVKGATD